MSNRKYLAHKLIDNIDRITDDWITAIIEDDLLMSVQGISGFFAHHLMSSQVDLVEFGQGQKKPRHQSRIYFGCV